MTRHVTRMSIEDAGHISPERRAEIIAAYPIHEREARVKGMPALGSGRVFPVSQDDIQIEPFEIPAHFAQIGGIDFGYDHPTAAVKLSHDRDNDTVIVSACYRVKEQPPLVHAAALKGWGPIPFAWPHDAYRRMTTGSNVGMTLKAEYENHGLNMLPEKASFEDGGNGVEPGLMMMLERMMSGRLKVFSNCLDWFDEFRHYHRKNGVVVDKVDDLMDATRYALMMLRFAETRAESSSAHNFAQPDNSWVV